MPQRSRIREKTWPLKLPIIGVYIEIASDYACEGSGEYFEKIPPFVCWKRTLLGPLFISMILAALPLPLELFPFSLKIEAKPYDVAFAIIPSLLGFGIGAYALVFGLSGDILRKIQDAHSTKENLDNTPEASVLSINSAFAFPLATMALSLAFASIQKIFTEILPLAYLTWFLTFFCVILTYQLIASLYRIGRVIILEKI